ncbi:MAG TPA: hypothetical protein VIK78_12410 [Ruminiclostridium sp.]
MYIKPNCIYNKIGFTDKDIERNILSNPFKRFEDMNMLRHTKTIGIIEVDSAVWSHLDDNEKKEIQTVCDMKLDEYFEKISK